MKVVGIIQARMGSTRLPGKVMLELCGMPVLAHVIRAVHAIKRVDEVVVATTQNPADEVIAACAKKYGTSVFRGSEDDVLDRYYQAAKHAAAGVVLRVTSDCPFLDADLISMMISDFLAISDNRRLDYMSNTLVRSFPRGFDAELMTFTALQRAWCEAKSVAEREHVTAYIYRRPDIFRLCGHRGARDLSKYRLTLDTEEDWRVIQAVGTALESGRSRPTANDLIRFLDTRPDIALLNAHVEQKKLDT